MPFPIIAGAALAGGTILQLMAQADEAALAKQQAEQESYQRMQMARETLLRARINERAIRAQGEDFKASQISASARAGVDPSGSLMSLLADTQSKIELSILNNRREAQYQATQYASSAYAAEAGIAGIQKANQLRQIGTLLGSAGAIASLHDPNTKNPKTQREKTLSYGRSKFNDSVGTGGFIPNTSAGSIY